jgi:hypothetical protein
MDVCVLEQRLTGTHAGKYPPYVSETGGYIRGGYTTV